MNHTKYAYDHDHDRDEELRENMANMKGSLATFLHLDELPEIDVDKYKLPWQQAQDPQRGETRHAWMIELPAEDSMGRYTII